MAPAYHIENFGCRSARADGEAVSDRLHEAGLREEPLAQADVVVVNTCSVTAEADRAARAFIRRTRRLNPEARIMVTGCYAQRAPEEVAGLAGVAAVVGNSHKALAPGIAVHLADGTAIAGLGVANELLPVHTLLASGPSAPVWVDDRFAHSFVEEAHLAPGLAPGEQTRPNLKIQEGCGNRCTFCVIPQTRGSSRSLPADAVLRQVEGFVRAGGNELVLSGINLGRWGRDVAVSSGDPKLFLAALVARIFRETGLARLRLSSVEPMDWDPDLIALMREFGGKRLARHAHLPLQSGSDTVLRRMHRRYRPWHYAEKVTALLEAAGPELTLGADVMVGFPGESDAEFEETYEFVRTWPFGYLHLFPFSPRPGTRGWTLHAETPVPGGIVEERMAALRALAAGKTETHRRGFVGRRVEAITLHTPAAVRNRGRTLAMTENFLPVEIDSPLPANQLTSLRVAGIGPDLTLLGTANPPKADP
jgi:threonylcarbamoyladenosine tRNA methylthiotransferase MtaB